MEFQEIRTHSGVSKVESRISQRLTPLAEMAKWMFGVEIQGTSMANCSPGRLRSKYASRPSEAAKVPSELRSAHMRLPLADTERGMASAIRKPARGRKRTRSRRF